MQSLFLICHQDQWFSSFHGPASQVALDFKSYLSQCSVLFPKSNKMLLSRILVKDRLYLWFC